MCVFVIIFQVNGGVTVKIMREKQEREGVGKASSSHARGVRVSEFDAGSGDNFVKRLNREATSFFFTHFLEDTLVVDLWRVFAKYGRVGEVYVPKKLDKWGRRFGFVKYLEVKNVEDPSHRLEDVRIDNHKLRINLSFFGRNGKPAAPNITRPSGVDKKLSEGLYNRGGVEQLARPGKSFRVALEGEKTKESVVVGLPQLPKPMIFVPNRDLISVLKGGFVGSIALGSSLKNIQLNICLHGLRGIRAASLGDGCVVLFSEVGEDVGVAIGRRSWWEGLLVDLQPWSPSVVATKREVWVRIIGVPLQLWEEQVFRSLTASWGDFLGMDDDTKGCVRFDRARVKLLSPILGSIDFSLYNMVEGLSFSVRCLEESCSPLEFVHVQREDDQLQWSTVASSCDSGENR
jgi:hypothetical protein